ncbi:MAG: hypothetical protein RJB38_802 [Pseudomonadota bacterium]|jgi:signal transduction histidine kinase
MKHCERSLFSKLVFGLLGLLIVSGGTFAFCWISGSREALFKIENKVLSFSSHPEGLSVDGVLQLVTQSYREINLLAAKGIILWILFSVVSVFIGWRIYRSIVRPIRYLADYFDHTVFDEKTAPLFLTVQDRERSGVDDAACEVRRLFQGAEDLIRRLAEFQSFNIDRYLQQQARADALGAALRDGVFFLNGTQVVWANEIGRDLLSADRSGQGQGLEPQSPSNEAPLVLPFDLSEQNNPDSLAGAILALRENALTQEWKRRFLLYRFRSPVTESGKVVNFDSVVIAQDVTWMKEVEEAKSHFVGLLSHEVRTPVTSLLMASRLLQRSLGEGFDPKQKKLVDGMVRDVERLRDLVEDFFQASRIDLSSDGLTLRQTDLRRVLKHAVLAVRDEADSRRMAVDLAFDRELQDCTIEADGSKLSWAMMQLLGESVWYGARESSLRISMGSAQLSDGAQGFRIVVRNQGQPLTEELRVQLFDRKFAKYDLRVARSNPTGMSLAIAREIVVAHGGSLVLNPGYQEGMEFILMMPQQGGSERGL